MKRFVLVSALALTACAPPLTPDPLPPLSSSALGQTLSLSGRAERWPGQAATLRWVAGGAAIGEVAADGAFTVSAAQPPAGLPRVSLLTALGLWEGADCSLNTVTLSRPGTEAFVLTSLPVGAPALGAANSPVVQPPQLRAQRGEAAVTLLYVPHDVTVSGQRVCRSRTSEPTVLLEEARSVNLALKIGWNALAVQSRSTGQVQAFGQTIYRSTVTVQGDTLGSGVTWTFLSDSLPKP
ncbi:hypothetical protein GO986_11015 [Deinococcus sp. HMF7620]|uniref:Lipoprotein n=1 Tax=Deinococcus arboris TaxID=2682977 RepID=A0A7C9M262_9DEIO|nr:hypothetical protein [Deinococcus arboris]MVN87302.1 hypothetical protein [Deinococcus arboris]